MALDGQVPHQHVERGCMRIPKDNKTVKDRAQDNKDSCLSVCADFCVFVCVCLGRSGEEG